MVVGNSLIEGYCSNYYGPTIYNGLGYTVRSRVLVKEAFAYCSRATPSL